MNKTKESAAPNPRRVLMLISLLFAACLFLPVPDSLRPRAVVPATAHPMRVLFIGNSFTFGGELPQLVEELSLKTARPIDTEMYAPGGVSMSWHQENKASLDAIAQSNWDFVVLQDCSTCPLQYQKYFREGIKEMVKAVRAANATPLLFMTWADLHKQNDISTIAQQYVAIGTELDVTVVPVGVAWKLAQERPSGAALFESDGHHASRSGALLSSYVFLAVLQKNSDQPTTVRLRKAPEFMYQLLFPEYQEYADETLSKNLKAIAAESLGKAALNDILASNAANILSTANVQSK